MIRIAYGAHDVSPQQALAVSAEMALRILFSALNNDPGHSRLPFVAAKSVLISVQLDNKVAERQWERNTHTHTPKAALNI